MIRLSASNLPFVWYWVSKVRSLFSANELKYEKLDVSDKHPHIFPHGQFQRDNDDQPSRTWAEPQRPTAGKTETRHLYHGLTTETCSISHLLSCSWLIKVKPILHPITSPERVLNISIHGWMVLDKTLSIINNSWFQPISKVCACH